MGERRNDLEIVIEILQIASQIPNSDRSPLYDVRNPARASCEGHACEVMFSRTNLLGRWSARLRPRGLRRACFVFGPVAAPRVAEAGAWWRKTGTHRRLRTCEALAIPHQL